MAHDWEDEELEWDALHVGATRPAMLWGTNIPLVVIVPTIVFCLEVEFMLGFQMAMLIDIPFAICMFAMVMHDYNAHRLWHIYLITKAKTLDDWHWGGVCVSPFPVARDKKRPRGIPSHEW
jgi:type IV secretion system protein VirB3